MSSEDIVGDQAKESNNLREKFFFQLTLLATGIFSLLVPFIQSLKNVLLTNLFFVIGLLLSLSIISSSLRNFFWAKVTWYWALKNAGIINDKQLRSKNKLHKWALRLEIFSILSFIFATVLSLIFVSINLLNANTEDLFTKKKMCAELQNEIEARIEKEINDVTRTSWLKSIFYSPKLNTCMYTLEIYLNESGNTGYNLIDAYTNKTIISEGECIQEKDCDKSDREVFNDFRDQLIEYE